MCISFTFLFFSSFGDVLWFSEAFGSRFADGARVRVAVRDAVCRRPLWQPKAESKKPFETNETNEINEINEIKRMKRRKEAIERIKRQ